MPKTKIDPNNRFEKLFKKNKTKIETFFRTVGAVVFGLFILEMFFWGLFKLRDFTTPFLNSGITDLRFNQELFLDQEWTKDYFKEFNDSNVAIYKPYIGHARVPSFRGKYINIDENSLRETIGNCPTENTFEILFFGGSTAWGTGARDEHTIPSLLAQELCFEGYSVSVVNYGESGYTSTQEVLRLLLELQKGVQPDLVVFYDGHNDVWSSYQNNEAGLPQNNFRRIKEFNSSQRFYLAGIFPNFFRFLQGVLPSDIKTLYGESFNQEKLVLETAFTYLNNAKLVLSLEETYGFDSLFIWQPILSTKTNLSATEKDIKANEIVSEMYNAVTELVVISGQVKDFTDVFGSEDSTVYIDRVHVSEYGNSIIAKEIAEQIKGKYGK